MKNIFLTTIVLFGLILTTYSQDKKFGLKVGVNFSELNDLDATSKLGVIIGATYVYEFNDAFSIQPELVFSSQGAAEMRYDGRDITLNYLNLPIMAQYKLSFFKGVSIEAGPQFGYLLCGKSGENKLADPNELDISFGIGGTYQISEDVNLGLRGLFGLTDTDIKDSFNTAAFMNNQVLQFTIGYKLPFRKRASKLLEKEIKEEVEINTLKKELVVAQTKSKETAALKVVEKEIKEKVEVVAIKTLEKEVVVAQAESKETAEPKEINKIAVVDLTPVTGLNENTFVINFGSNKYIPNNKYRKDLARIAKQLESDENLKVTIEGHTDSKSYAEYNLEISKLRANWVHNYFVNSKGIDENRVSNAFYGETKLTNNCDDKIKCTDEQHQENRRVVIKMN